MDSLIDTPPVVWCRGNWGSGIISLAFHLSKHLLVTWINVKQSKWRWRSSWWGSIWLEFRRPRFESWLDLNVFFRHGGVGSLSYLANLQMFWSLHQVKVLGLEHFIVHFLRLNSSKNLLHCMCLWHGSSPPDPSGFVLDSKTNVPLFCYCSATETNMPWLVYSEFFFTGVWRHLVVAQTSFEIKRSFCSVNEAIKSQFQKGTYQRQSANASCKWLPWSRLL